MDFLVLILILYLSWLVLHFLRFITARGKPCPLKRNLPPGPQPLPVIGNLHELGALPYKSLARLARTHGPVMKLELGRVTTIVISSASMAKEVLQTHDIHFSNRTIPDTIKAHGQDGLGLPWVPVASLWRTLRRICNLHLFSSKSLDANRHVRHEKVQELLSHVGNFVKAGEAVDIGEAAFMTSLNLLSNTILSQDLAGPMSGSSTREFKKIVWEIMVEAGRPNLSDYFPAIKWMDLQGARRRMTKYVGQLLDLFETMIDKRLRQRETGSLGIRGKSDMLDLLIDICEDKNENMMEVFRIKHLFLDLFVAGTDTTSNTLEWAMAELLRNPETLSRAQAELEQVIGKGKRVEESDIPRLPYLQAVVKETLRLHPPAPLLLPHKAGSTMEVGGYTIPEGTQVLVNAWAIGRDPTAWEDPEKFSPERFLGSDIDIRGQNFEVIPFGAGRRICPGLPLAIRMLHLMLGSLVHFFDWKLQAGFTAENMDMEEKFGLTIRKAQPLLAVPVPNNM